MRVSTPSAIATFPRGDTAFAALVERLYAGLGGDPDPRALERALRPFHTRAIVSPQEPIASLGPPIWYVYRDGTISIQADDRWWDDPTCARVVFDDGIVVEANDAAAALVGLDVGRLVGLSGRALVPAGSLDDFGFVRQAMNEAGFAQSVFDHPTGDGGRRVIEYRIMPGGDHRSIAYWRAVAEIDPATVDRLVTGTRPSKPASEHPS